MKDYIAQLYDGRRVKVAAKDTEEAVIKAALLAGWFMNRDLWVWDFVDYVETA